MIRTSRLTSPFAHFSWLPLLLLSIAMGCSDDGPGTGGVGAQTEEDTTADDTGGARDQRDADSEPVDVAEIEEPPEEVADSTGADTEDVSDETVADVEEEIDPGEIDNGELIDFVPADVPRDNLLFPMGVQAGSMTPSSVLLWTYSTEVAPLTLRVWRSAGTVGQVILVHDLEVEPNDAGYFSVPIDGLAPGTRYGYGFFVESEESEFSARSEEGHFLTAWRPGSLRPVVVGSSHGTNRRYTPWTALQTLAEEDIDVFIHLGDMSYNDPADTLAEYRAVWQQTLSDPGYLALLPTVGTYVVWDDHEVANDYDPESINRDQLAAGKQAFFEAVPMVEGENGELWTSYMWGDTAEFIVLDCRSERRPSTRLFDGATYISQEQMTWLQDRLLNSTAHFKVVLNSVPITNMPGAWDFAANDRWEGYRAQRNELLDFITDNELQNVWFLTGDFHLAFVARLEKDGPRNRYREIMVGPSGNGPNPLASTLPLHTQFENVRMEVETYTLITFDPIDDSVHLQYFDIDGDLLSENILREGE